MKLPSVAASLILVMFTAPAYADEPEQKLVKAIVAQPDGTSNLEEALAATKKRGMDALLVGDHVKAAQAFTWCLRFGSDDDDVKEGLKEAKKNVGTVRLEIPEPNVTLSIDGDVYHLLSEIGPDVFLMPGKHTIEATKEGFAPTDATITVQAGEERELLLSMWDAREGTYRRVLGVPTRVLLDVDAKMGAAPETPTWPRNLIIAGFVGLGAGTAMVVTGVTLTPESTNWRAVTIGGGILGGLSLVAIGVGWAWKPNPPQAPIIVQPVISNQTTGASISGRW